MLSKAGPRAEDFHRLQLDRLAEPIQAVEIDELHAPLASPKKGENPVLALLATSRRRRGSTWIHVALAAASRFVIELRLGPRTLESARELLASVAAWCRPGQPLLIEADEHRPYPQAILDLFGVTRFRRRRHGRGRRKHPDLKPPPGLLVGVVHKVRDACGNLLRVKTRRLFGRRRDILKLLNRLKVGRRINTGHIERLNGTMRTQQTRLARRTRNVSHAAQAAAVGAVALARPLSLGASTPFVGWPHASHGHGLGRGGVDCS